MRCDGLTVAFCGMDRIRAATVFDYIKGVSRNPRRIASRFGISEIHARNIVNLYDKKKEDEKEFHKNYIRW